MNIERLGAGIAIKNKIIQIKIVILFQHRIPYKLLNRIRE